MPAKTSKAKTLASQRADASRPAGGAVGSAALRGRGRRRGRSRPWRTSNEICEEHLAGQYRIEVVDLLKNPQLARGDQILAVPTLVRKLPEPVRKIIGDLSNTERVLVGLDLRPR